MILFGENKHTITTLRTLIFPIQNIYEYIDKINNDYLVIDNDDIGQERRHVALPGAEPGIT